MAAEALLDKRLQVNVPAPWFLRVFKIKRIPVWFKRPVFSQLLRISRLYVSMGIDLEKLDEGEAMRLFSEIARHGKTASRIIAHGLIRGSIGAFFFHRPLALYLRRHMDAKSLAELSKLIIYLSGGENFANIIRSVAYMRVTIPNLSHDETES
ncbi:hypothetical protein LJC39_01850 [Parabacteroides sp. OttesenSCG-928-B22]|nr:hypothetical protein [Parabacteroides sp. OttesenSCG-928-B22]